MSKAKDPAVVLSEQLVAVLKAQRDLGPDAYPLPLDRLTALTDAAADPELVKKALGKKPFKAGALVALKDHPASPVALAEDVARLADSPALLELALELTCTEAVPAVAVTALPKKLHKDLKKPFVEAVARRVQANDLPAAVDCQMVKNKSLLFLKRMPPPPPPPPKKPKVKPEVELAANLLRVLEAQRDLGDNAYPLMLQKLVALTDPAATPALAKKALGVEPLKERVLLGVTLGAKVKDSPVSLAEDREALLGSPAMLDFLLRGVLSESDRAVSFDKLATKPSKALQADFKNLLEQRSAAGTLPPGFGWMWIGKKKQLFLLEDVHTAGRPGTPAARPAPSRPSEPPPPADFAAAFEDAFRRLDREQGGHNFVNLVELRRAVPVDRTTFDRGLRELRLAGRFGLSAAEGRHGLKAEEQEAGIIEDGTLLLHVSRKSP